MPHTCVVEGCRINSINKPEGVHLVRFPKDERLPLWIERVKGKDASWVPKSWTRICTLHFEPKCFWTDARKQNLLLPNAIPSPSKFRFEKTAICKKYTGSPLLNVYRKKEVEKSPASVTNQPSVLLPQASPTLNQSGQSPSQEPPSTPIIRRKRRALNDVTNQVQPSLSWLQKSTAHPEISQHSFPSAAANEEMRSVDPYNPHGAARVNCQPVQQAPIAVKVQRMLPPSLYTRSEDCIVEVDLDDESYLPSRPLNTSSDAVERQAHSIVEVDTGVEVVTPPRKRSNPFILDASQHKVAADFAQPINLEDEDDDTPRKKVLKEYLRYMQRKMDEVLQNQTRLVKTVDRLRDHVEALQDIVKKVRNNMDAGEAEAVTVFKAQVPEETWVLLRRLVGVDKGQYGEVLRTFALTLHFYSPAAYRYFREKVNNRMPCERTIRMWYSVMGGAPGFTEEAFKAIEAITKRHEGLPLPVVLIVDDMKIKSHVEMVGGQPVGLVNYGGIIDVRTREEVKGRAVDPTPPTPTEDTTNRLKENEDFLDGELPEEHCTEEDDFVTDQLLNPPEKEVPNATDACVFFLVFLTLHIKLPIGYFLHNGLRGSMLAVLVRHAVNLVHKAGVEVQALVADGAAANFTMARLLGGQVNARKYRMGGRPPSVGDHVNWVEANPVLTDLENSHKSFHFLPDVAHMIKLVRNTLAIWGTLIDLEGKKVEWRFIEQLAQYQEDIGCHFGNRLRRVHIEWCRQKMKTKYAVQTLSNSVADALVFLEKGLKLPTFSGASATARFIKIFNDLFDVLNSRNRFGKGLKAPMSKENRQEWEAVFTRAELYMKGLKDPNGNNVFNTKRERAFRGLLLAMASMKSLFKRLVESGHLAFLLTYKFSQDAIEMFFGAIRQRGGHNDNPTGAQFMGAYKRLLFRNQVRASSAGNATLLDVGDITILTASSTMKKADDELTTIFDSNLQNYIQSFDRLFIADSELGSSVDAMVTYLSGYVAGRLFRACPCMECACALVPSEPSVSGDVYGFVRFKAQTYERAQPSLDVLAVCRLAERAMQHTQRRGFNISEATRKRKAAALSACGQALQLNVFQCLAEHVKELGVLENHVPSLIQEIFLTYWTIKEKYVCSLRNDQLSSGSRRQISRKQNHFANQ